MYISIDWVAPDKMHTPTEKIKNTPASLDILYKFKTFFTQFLSPFPNDGNFLCG